MKLNKITIRLFSALLTAIIIFASVAPAATAINMEDVGAVVGSLAQQLGDAYKKAYEDAKENGTIDQINLFLDEAKSIFAQTEQWIDDNTELLPNNEFEDQLRLAIKNAKPTVEKIRELINNADELDEETLTYAESLLESLYVNVLDLFELLRIAADYAGENLPPEIKESIAEAEKSIAELQKTAAEIIAELEAEADERIADITAEAEEKIARLRLNASERIKLLGDLLASADEEEQKKILEEIRMTEEKLAQDIAEIEKMLAEQTESITVWLIESIEAVNERLDVDIATIAAKLGGAMDSLTKAVAELARLAGMDETLGEALRFIEDGINDVWSRASEYISQAMENYTTLDYNASEESFYIAIGSDTAYANMFADELLLTPEQYVILGWDQLTPETIKKADLISVSFNENQLNGFAVDQMLGYVADYINAELRDDFIIYVEGAISEFLTSAVPILKPFIAKKVTKVITDAVNQGLDDFCAVQLGGNTAMELDWADVVGEENVESIDSLRETVKNEISALGIEENYAYEVSIVDLIYDNLEDLKDADSVEPEVAFLLKLIGKEAFAELLGEYSTYTLNIPMSDAVMFSGESYVYSYIRFTRNYIQTVIDINELNPDAKIILLGHYNAFGGLAISMGDISIDVGKVYENLARLTCITPFVHAVFIDNVTYVDIFDAQTVYGARIAEGESSDMLMFVFNYMTDRTLTNISGAGHAYICGRMLASMKKEITEDPAPPPAPPAPQKQMPKGILVAIANGATAVVGISAYAVARLVKRKKRPSDPPVHMKNKK